MSAAANLSSLAGPSPSSTFLATPDPPHDAHTASPSGTDASHASPATSRDPHRNSFGSPVTDREQLIGLGELATPRWTSGPLEKRWGAPIDDETFYPQTIEEEPMPTIRTGGALVESPTVARPVPRRSLGRAPHSFDSPDRPLAYSTSALHAPAPLLPTSASTATIATDGSPAALLRFAYEQPHSFGPVEFSTAPSSAPPREPTHDILGTSPARSADVPRRRGSQRKSTASSAPNSASTGRSWTLGNDVGESEVVGLGFEHDIQLPAGLGDDAQAERRRASSGGAAPTSSKRTGTRTLSIDGGKTSGKHLRRQSTGKASFAHLPPSPAASSSSHVFTAQPSADGSVPALPPLAAFPPSPSHAHSSSAAPPMPTSTASTPGRTPDHSRLSRHSFHSHHSSPSVVAASILRQTRDLEGVDLDIDKAAAIDEGTAAALAKLDGLSPRLSRLSTGGGGSGFEQPQPRSRKSSRNTSDMPANSRRDSSQSAKRRARNSMGESIASTAAREADPGAAAGGSGGNSRVASRSGSPVPPPPALPSPSALSAPTFASPGKSPLSSSVAQMPSTVRTSSQNRLASSTASAPVDVPFPATSPWKRGSSSSTSMTAGTSTSATGSHDSTSATSFATRSPASKHRRSSAGSDVSSVHSGGDGRPALDRTLSGEEVARAAGIPPVPPLPKDWETYRPTTSATSATMASQPSPRFFDSESRRPSDTSTAMAAPSSAALQAPPMSVSRTTSSSGRSTQGESQLPVPTSATSTGSSRRKWSISHAFHKATKSPKASSSGFSGVKESSSFTDLQSAAGRRLRTTSFGQSGLPRRLAASTNNLSTLADASDPLQPSGTAATTGSLGRSSMRNGQIPTFMRQRTPSQSSSSTARTAQWASQAGGSSGSASMPPPSVVTTSPGRSRSSVINPRRTPSGIPFFSRKSSNASSDVSATTPSPNLDSGEPFRTPSSEDKGSGRKSILGLNFLRSGSSKREKEKGLLSPPSASRSTFSSATTLSTSSQPAANFDEFGRRASLATPKTASSLMRKRGKTLSSADQGDVFRVPEPVQLPPMQINALPASTARRLESLGSSRDKTASAPSTSTLQTPRTRASRLQEVGKAHLPTIAGSPSTHGLHASVAESSSTGPSPSSTPPPKSHTPTRIPRLHRTGTISPRVSPTGSSVSRKPVPRRINSYGSMQDGASQVLPASDNDTAEFGFVGRESANDKTLTASRRRVDSEAQSQIPRSRSSTSRSSSATRAPSEQLEASTSSRLSTAVPRDRRRPPTVDEEKKAPLATPLRSAQPRVTSLSSSTSRLSSSQAATSESSSSTATPSTLSSATRRSLPKPGESAASRRTSAPSESLSLSKTARHLSGKMAIPTRVSKPSIGSARQSPVTTDSGRSSAASGTYALDDDEARADEEMAAYVKRQVAKKKSAGASDDTIRQMFDFPDPTEPLPSLSPEDAISLYSRYLSPYEKEEIREHRKVYFVGPNCDKKQATKENTANNHGFDDDRGDYQLVEHDHIQFRYEVMGVLGKGSFGQVLQCRDHKTGEMVAVKIIRNKKRFHHQALVEIKVLENLVKWDPDEKHDVIRMVDSFTFRSHLCIVTELLSINLYELVKANSFHGFSTILIRRFAIQILHSLSLLRQHRVIHCDLKPENILLRHPAKSGIKTIDFGSSCFENEKVYTYIQSRFYRSPEVILGSNYTMAIDMWSLGCILAEMYTGYPIFPGENEQEQLSCIMELMGVPDKHLVDRSSRKRLFFDSTGAPRPVVNSKGRRRRPGSKTLVQVLRCEDELFVDFIAKCLAWDPERRLKPDQAMRHPFIAGSRSPQTSIPARTSRSSGLSSTSTASRHASYSGSGVVAGSSSNISTPMKKTAASSVSTAPVGRTRTMSSSIASAASSARASAKASLPASSRFLKS
ncbi:hypothetical protein Rhopal_000304-T1 [Rhodotorula paludigena]|uniref:dual-specificity kinase n=1 Tax=Rhodotorula paludigena TaxID=86838 RepID=A0AAV5GC64_9BASI|nr:hypothetical protein Rhopal_000304-T1 [Rhodotorula paludigena]